MTTRTVSPLLTSARIRSPLESADTGRVVVHALERQRKTQISAVVISLIADLHMHGPPGVYVLGHHTPPGACRRLAQGQVNSSRPSIRFAVMIWASERSHARLKTAAKPHNSN